MPSAARTTRVGVSHVGQIATASTRWENGAMEPEPPSVPRPLADPGDIARGSSRTAEVMASRPSRVRVATVAAALTAAWIALVVWVNESTPGVPQLDSQLHAWVLDHRTDMTIHLARCLLYTSDAADDLLCVDLGGR